MEDSTRRTACEEADQTLAVNRRLFAQ